MDARDNIAALLAERGYTTGAQESAILDPMADAQHALVGAPMQGDVFLDPSLQNRYGSYGQTVSPEWMKSRPKWAALPGTASHGTNWMTEGSNVLSPSVPQWMRDQEFGKPVGPYTTPGSGGTVLPQQQPTANTAAQATYGGPGGTPMPPTPGSPSPFGQMPGSSSTNSTTGADILGGGAGPSGGMPWQQMFSRFGGRMPGSPSGFGGKATPGSQPTTIG